MDHSCLLSDLEIEKLSNKSFDKPLVAPFDDNRIDSASYELGIGTVYKPSLKKDPSTETSWTLGPGEMAVIVTLEKINMSNELVGIVFGTNTFMTKGVLVVNPGIITSGHSDEVTFFVINLSKTNVVLAQGDSVARITFFSTVKNKIDPRRATGNAHGRALVLAQEKLNKDFGGYFKTLVSPKLSTYIATIVISLLCGTIIFGLILSMLPILSPIIAEKIHSVPEIRREIAELKKELEAVKAKVTSDTPERQTESDLQRPKSLPDTVGSTSKKPRLTKELPLADDTEPPKDSKETKNQRVQCEK